MRQVIRADLDPRSPTRPPTSARAFAAPLRRSARDEPDLGESPGNASLSAAAPIPAWARASGRAGEGDPLFFAGAGLALLDACLRRDPPAAGALRAAPGASERRGLRQDPAPQRRRSRAARPALRRRRRPGAGREAPSALARPRRPAAQPRPRPARRRGGRARSGRGPERPRGQPEGAQRAGRSGLGRRQGGRPGLLRLPGRPSGRSRNPRPLGVRHRHRASGCAGRGPCR